MQVFTDISEIRSTLRALRKKGCVGLVPTMGALHAGHRSLMLAARGRCDVAVASIFVNPTQFGPTEDFGKYPRTFAEDCRLLEAAGVDLLFHPAAEEMYPPGATTFVEVGDIGNRLDGASRPGHFRGVATVVAKLFNIIQPDFTFFGQKDAAQVAVLRRVVSDLNLPGEMVVCPTVRETDGLAMSSRNRYLSIEERQQALELIHALEAARALADQGESRVTRLVETMTRSMQASAGIRVDYIAVVDPHTLLPLEDVGNGALLAIAAYVGSTRLIDNILLSPTR